MVRTATNRPNSVQFLLNSVSDREHDYCCKAERRCRRRILRYSSAIRSVMAHRTGPPRPGRPAIHPPPPPPPHVINPLNMDFLFEKRLQYSDVTSLGRIVIPKFVAELCFPPIAEKEGTWMFLDDMSCEMVWTFRFRFWLNTGSRMYLFDNARDFILEKNLDWGDSVKWYKDRVTGTYAISATKIDEITKCQFGSDSSRNIIVNPALLSPPPCLSLNTCQSTEKDSEMAQDSAMEHDSAMEQLAVTGEVEAAETNSSKTKPPPSFIDTNPPQTKPSLSFINLDDNAAALATTAYDVLFAVDTNPPPQTEPSFSFIDLDDNAAALATTAYDELFDVNTNPPRTEPSFNFIDTNAPPTEPSFRFIDLDDNAAALATTAYDELFAVDTNLLPTERSFSFIDMNRPPIEPSFRFIDLDDNAAALATTAYDELFTDPAGGHSFWNFGDDLNAAGMGLPITPVLEDGKKLEDMPEPGSNPINPFFMSM